MSAVPQNIVDAIIAAWPVITGLSGVLIGGYIANKNQRKQSIMESKRAEYRELLTTMTKTFNMILMLAEYHVVVSGDDERLLSNMESECSVVIKDRIFIAPEVMRDRIR